MKTISHMSEVHRSRHLRAISASEMHSVIRRARHDMQLQVFLVLCWARAGRSGDILQIRTPNISFHESENDHMLMSFQFSEGKVVKSTGPFTVHTVVPEEWARNITALIQSRTDGDFLLPLTTRQERTRFMMSARSHLRQIDPTMDLRAVRRGATRTLAALEVPLSTIMLFTRHTSLQTLRIYLGFGSAAPSSSRRYPL
eukprot:PhM_4_TR3007/c0_g3_i2/m.37694